MTFIRSIPFNLIVSILLVYGLLILAEVILFIKKHRMTSKDLTEFHQRIRSWWIMVSIVTIVLIIDRKYSVVLLGILSFLALKEYFSVIPIRRADRRVIFWAYLTIPMQYYFVAIGWYGMFIIFIPVYMFLIIPCRMILIGETKNFLQATGTIYWGIMMTVYCLSHASYLLSMPPLSHVPAGNAGLLFFLLLLTQINDVAQYIWGKSFGHNKILPNISPGKTTIGLVGGIISTALVSMLIAPYLTPLNAIHSLIIGCLTGLFGFIGDVNISAVKRDIGIKDMGSLIPGHGGVLDRVDSLTFTAPIFFHYLNYFYF